jgi:hypothetical protein
VDEQNKNQDNDDISSCPHSVSNNRWGKKRGIKLWSKIHRKIDRIFAADSLQDCGSQQCKEHESPYLEREEHSNMI